MNQWDEEALREINNLDAARLAIRGALATIRDLQDQNLKLKEDSEAALQDETSRRKTLESKVKEQASQLEAWSEQGKAWEEEQKKRASDESRWKSAIRVQVRAEERARLESAQRGLEEDLARLQSELERMAGAQQDKEQKWIELRKKLEQRENDLLASEREKIEIANNARHGAELVERMRQQRDREIAASIRSRELELEDKTREIESLRAALEEHKKALAGAGSDLELKRREYEEGLLKAYRQKEHDLTERYAKREMELQASWAELENGLWKRAKDARDKLDQAAEQQFAERARALADRSREIEALLASRRQELDEDFKRRCDEAEARYAANERRLLDGWAEKEARQMRQYEIELAHEKALHEQAYQDKLKELRQEYALRGQTLDARELELDATLKHREQRLLEEASHKEGERIRRNDDFIARKSAELEADLSRRRSELQQEFTTRTAQAQEELSKLKTDVLEEQRRVIEAEKAALKSELDSRTRSIEETFAAKSAELERAHQAAAEQFAAWRSNLVSEYAQKEKTLDARWFAREQELVRRYETMLEQQRQSFAGEARRTRDQLEKQREREIAELGAAMQARADEFDKREGALREEIARRDAEQAQKREQAAEQWRAHYHAALERQAHQAAEEAARLRAEQAQQLAAQREKHHSELSLSRERVEAAEQQAQELREQMRSLEQSLKAALAEEASRQRREHDQKTLELREKQQSELGLLSERLQASDLETKALRERLAAAQKQLAEARSLQEERERAWDAERLAMERQARERDAAREKRYLELEQSMQSLWSQKEAQAVAARLAALEKQHAHYAEQVAKAEDKHRLALEQWKDAAAKELEKAKLGWSEQAREELERRVEALRAEHLKQLEVERAGSRSREEAAAQQHAEELNRLRAELDSMLHQRERAVGDRFLTQEKELAERWRLKQEQLELDLKNKLEAERRKAAEDERRRGDIDLEKRMADRERELQAEWQKQLQEKLATVRKVHQADLDRLRAKLAEKNVPPKAGPSTAD